MTETQDHPKDFCEVFASPDDERDYYMTSGERADMEAWVKTRTSDYPRERVAYEIRTVERYEDES